MPLSISLARQKIKDAFYDGAVWNRQIEPLVMHLIAHFEVEVTESTGHFESFSDPSNI